MAWPPTLAALKVDMKVDEDDTADDDRRSEDLAAAVAFVGRVRAASFNFAGDLDSALPDPTADIELGTKRLAARWYLRRRSPDAIVQLGQEMGASRVPSFDPDIDRLLGIGRFAGPVFA